MITTLLAYIDVLPWLLAALFAWLWWRQRGITATFRDAYLDKVSHPIARKRSRRRAGEESM